MDPHAQLVNMLAIQNAMANGEPVETRFGQMSPGAVVYEPITVTKPFKDQPTGSGQSPEPNIFIGAKARIDSYVKLEGGQGLSIGAGVHIASFAHLNVGGGTLVIENGAAVASHVVIITGGNAPDAESCSAAEDPAKQVIHSSMVRIGKNACLYAGAIVCPGVTIGEGARVAAGAVVTKDVPPFAIVAGNPAKFMRFRNDALAVSRVRVVDPSPYAKWDVGVAAQRGEHE